MINEQRTKFADAHSGDVAILLRHRSEVIERVLLHRAKQRANQVGWRAGRGLLRRRITHTSMLENAPREVNVADATKRRPFSSTPTPGCARCSHRQPFKKHK